MAEVCSYYHWTLEYVLNMPATQFFAMLEAARKCQLLDKIEACDIQAISICNQKYYEYVRGRYSSQLEESPIIEENKNIRHTDRVIELGTDEAKSLLINLCVMQRRSEGLH